MAEPITIRMAATTDIPTLRELFEADVYDGHTRINDTGADIENLKAGYFDDEGRSGFWVAEAPDRVVGMIGVQCVGDEIAEIKRLRVLSEFRRRGIGASLLDHAVKFCRSRDYVKIVLDVRKERDPAIHLFEKAGFFLARTREAEGHKTLDFYVDLYTDPSSRS